MTPLRICLASSELTPFAKTGGLADVAGALTRYLHGAGHDVRSFLPLYRRIRESGVALHPVEFLRDVPVKVGPWDATFSVETAALPGTDAMVYLVDCPVLFDRESIYTGDPDEHLRFLLFSRAVLESCQRMGWSPHVVHANDWQTAFLPLYVKHLYDWDRLFADTRSVLTIHNIGYQGTFPADILPDTGMADHADRLHAEDLTEGRIGFLKTGILYADAVTTVSRTYAREIQTPEYGVGLDDLLRARSDSLVGIVNGVDYDIWDPATDPHLAANYTPDNLAGKETNKQAVLEALGLPYRPGVPLLGIVSRLAAQKGFDLFPEMLPAFLRETGVSLVVLGSGEPRFASFFRELRHAFPGQVGFYEGFHEPLAHLIEAGSDIFLMPSHYEPCGLNQMYSLKYGTLPVVRATGGLADTVEPLDPRTGEGTGFVFDHYTADGLRWALSLALETYKHPRVWGRMMQAAMSRDFSWDHQGQEYLRLYAALTGEPAGV